MTDLSDFGGGMSREPPYIGKTRGIDTNLAPGGPRRAGSLGRMPSPRDCLGFVKTVVSEEHLLRALDAYAISTDAFERLSDAGAERVLVVETDRGRVYEWRTSQFDTEVPAKFLASSLDTQVYATLDSASRYEGHAKAVFLPRGTPDAGFDRASDL